MLNENMIEYKIVSEDTITSLESIINELLKDGWFLYGDLVVTKTPTALLDESNSYFSYMQAVVKNR